MPSHVQRPIRVCISTSRSRCSRRNSESRGIIYGRRNKNRRIGWLRPVASGLSRTPSHVATPDATHEGNGLRFSVDEGQGEKTALLFRIRR